MPRNRFRGGFAALLIWLSAMMCVLPAQAAPRIGVATMQPGEIFFERFGHNAIIVDDAAVDGNAQNGPLSYNFGFFDMSEPDFIGRFVKGDMRYYLAQLHWHDDLQHYLDTGRGVSIQWLDLTPPRAPRTRSPRTRVIATNISPTTAPPACAMRSIARSAAR
jgi:hypothetical protein